MKKLSFFTLLLTSLILFSCQEKKNAGSNNDTTSTNKIEGSQLEIQYKALSDSTEKAWEIMIKSDDQKIADLTRLLQEITYCKKYNVLLHDSLAEAVGKLSAQRYDQKIMASSEKIDLYDDITNKIIRRVFFLARTTEELSAHPIAETLSRDIISADNDVVRYRRLYDQWAMQYNSFITQHKSELDALGNPYENLNKKALFTIGTVQ